MTRHCLSSPFGPLTLTEASGLIVRLNWGGTPDTAPTPLLAEAGRQLADYFSGTRTAFDLPVETGTGFRGALLRALLAIPHGQTRTYGDLARELSASAQAVGKACGSNRVPIIIPCHRVLAAGGLGGFSAPGGVETKIALLRHEGAVALLL
jgi:methylated-DNA-[protein]-cysteine S-methyltransferase